MQLRQILEYPISKERRKMLADEIVKEGSVSAQVIGTSTLGEPILMYSVGSGKRCSLYVGAHHALEAITENILWAFLFDIKNGVRLRTCHPCRRMVSC